MKAYIKQELPEQAHEAIAIVGCESGFNPEAKNPNSTATGLGQWIKGSWILYRRLMGRDTDPELRKNWIENLDTLIFARKYEGDWGNWLASINCHGYY